MERERGGGRPKRRCHSRANALLLHFPEKGYSMSRAWPVLSIHPLSGLDVFYFRAEQKNSQ